MPSAARPSQLERAQSAHDLASWRTAAHAYDAFVQETGSSDVLVALGDVRSDAAEPELAYAAYLRRCMAEPEDAEAFARLASAALAIGDGAAARASLRRTHALGGQERQGEIASPALRDAFDAATLRWFENLAAEEEPAAGLPVGAPLRASPAAGAPDFLSSVAVVTVLAVDGGDGVKAVRRARLAGEALAPGRHLTLALHSGPAPMETPPLGQDLLVVETGAEASPRQRHAVGLELARRLGADTVLRLDPAFVEPPGALQRLFAAFADPVVGCGVVTGTPDDAEGAAYGPPSLGPVVVLRARVLAEFGGLDAVFDGLHAATLDLCARANRAAFAAVRVGAPGAEARPVAMGAGDAAVLRSRHPALAPGERRFETDGRATALRLRTALRTARARLLVDMSSLRAHHDGTSRMSIAVLAALDALGRFDVEVACSREAARGHRLDGLAAAGRLVEPGAAGPWTACVKLSQPLSAAEAARTWRAAPVAGFVMHDAIIADSEALGAARVRDLWRLTLASSDLTGFVSEFARTQFARRFPAEAGEGERFVMRNSTAVHEYAGASQTRRGDGRRGGLLVVGNPFGHKNLDSTVRRLRARRPDTPLTVLGQVRSGPADIRWLHSGRLSDAEVAALYADADAVVFPSFQEGFGMPLLDALAAGSPVLALDQPAYHEIMARSRLGANVHLFPTTAALVAGVDAVLAGGFLPADPDVREHTWRDAATALADAVERAVAACDPARLRRRLAVAAALESDGLG